MRPAQYSEVVIRPAASGFGMWQSERGGSGEAWADHDDLLAAMLDGQPGLVQLGTAEAIAAGVPDIRGEIYDEPGEVWAWEDEDGWYYVGIDAWENTDEGDDEGAIE